MSAKQKILLVDDELELLKSGKALLETVGFDVTIADGGQKAIDIMLANQFELVLLDLNMPVVNGHDVMRFINENELDCKVIVLSGEVGFEWVSKAFQLGAYDFIQKPYSFDALRNTIKNALKKRELENSLAGLRKQLERSEKLHRFMIDSSPDMIFIVDKEGYFAFVNDRAEDLLGYKRDELIGKHFSHIIAEGYLDQAGHCFHERREGARAMKDTEIWLSCKAGLHKDIEKNKIAIELSSVGVYENEALEESVNPREFSGTYVVARDITERLAAEKLIHFQAYHDLLTNLPNRALFLDRLDKAIQESKTNGTGLTVMFLDLDRFKVVNDSLGHSVGDELLKLLSQRLKLALRENATLARLGGDEFIVLLPEVNSHAIACEISEDIINSVKQSFVIDDQEIFITASIGISLYPHDGENAETLIKNSDIAMYHTKELGKNSYNFYENDMSVKHHRLLNIENDIRRGIKENQFEVYYQPQVSTINGDVTGVEALLRWNHPEKGLLLPAFFLEVAEETGLIVDLGDWVLQTALKEMSIWQESGVSVESLAINFSNKQIEQKNFVNKILQALEKYKLPSTLLEVEVTESILMSDVDSAILKLKQIHDAGVNVAIDDFGTGYSSLSLLQKLPINRLKIDRSFIQAMGIDSDHSIIEAIAHMAKGLKLEMVAEGVEEHYQLDYLKQLDCPVIQGFLYSRGVPAIEAMKYIVENVNSQDKRKSQQNSFLEVKKQRA